MKNFLLVIPACTCREIDGAHEHYGARRTNAQEIENYHLRESILNTADLADAAFKITPPPERKQRALFGGAA